jgi:hypothetical protein
MAQKIIGVNTLKDRAKWAHCMTVIAAYPALELPRSQDRQRLIELEHLQLIFL